MILRAKFPQSFTDFSLLGKVIMTFPLPSSSDNYALNPSHCPELPMLGYDLLQSNECSCTNSLPGSCKTDNRHRKPKESSTKHQSACSVLILVQHPKDGTGKCSGDLSAIMPRGTNQVSTVKAKSYFFHKKNQKQKESFITLLASGSPCLSANTKQQLLNPKGSRNNRAVKRALHQFQGHLQMENGTIKQTSEFLSIF